jgi:hypothetical protein
MATDLPEISRLLNEEDIQHELDNERGIIRMNFETSSYRNQEGGGHIRVVVQVQEDGEFVQVFAPNAYECTADMDPLRKLSFFETLLCVSWMTKMMQFEHDPDTGEVRPMIEFPLEDSRLTRRQIVRCILSLVQIVDRHHESIVLAVSHDISPESLGKLGEEYREFLARRRMARSHRP